MEKDNYRGATAPKMVKNGADPLALISYLETKKDIIMEKEDYRGATAPKMV